MGVEIYGTKHVLGTWIQAREGARFWAQVCTELANRGVRYIVIACVAGLTGIAEATNATWLHAVVQTCAI